MSALNAFITSRGCYLCADTAVYDEQFRLVATESKLATVPKAKAVIGAVGDDRLAAEVLKHCPAGDYATLEAIVEAIPRVLAQTIATLARPVEWPSAFVVGGLDNRGRHVIHLVKTSAQQPTKAETIGPIFDWLSVIPMRGKEIKLHPKDAERLTNMDARRMTLSDDEAAEFARLLLEAQRRMKVDLKWLGKSAYAVGGRAELVKAERHDMTRRAIGVDWRDKIGAQINPWEAAHVG